MLGYKLINSKLALLPIRIYIDEIFSEMIRVIPIVQLNVDFFWRRINVDKTLRFSSKEFKIIKQVRFGIDVYTQSLLRMNLCSDFIYASVIQLSVYLHICLIYWVASSLINWVSFEKYVIWFTLELLKYLGFDFRWAVVVFFLKKKYFNYFTTYILKVVPSVKKKTQ